MHLEHSLAYEYLDEMKMLTKIYIYMREDEI